MRKDLQVNYELFLNKFPRIRMREAVYKKYLGVQEINRYKRVYGSLTYEVEGYIFLKLKRDFITWIGFLNEA